MFILELLIYTCIYLKMLNKLYSILFYSLGKGISRRLMEDSNDAIS